MRLTTHRSAVIAFAAIASLTMAARSAEAQLPKLSEFHPSFYGSTELDTRHSQFYLLGVYVGMGGLGWSPFFNANAYSLHYRLLRDVPASEATAPPPALAHTVVERAGARCTRSCWRTTTLEASTDGHVGAHQSRLATRASTPQESVPRWSGRAAEKIRRRAIPFRRDQRSNTPGLRSSGRLER